MQDPKKPAPQAQNKDRSAAPAHAQQLRQLLTAAQAAREVYGFSERTFHNMRNRGLIPPPVVLSSRCLRWIRRECEESLAALPRQVEPKPMPEQLRRGKIESLKARG